jgi:hypothetical protein
MHTTMSAALARERLADAERARRRNEPGRLRRAARKAARAERRARVAVERLELLVAS